MLNWVAIDTGLPLKVVTAIFRELRIVMFAAMDAKMVRFTIPRVVVVNLAASGPPFPSSAAASGPPGCLDNCEACEAEVDANNLAGVTICLLIAARTGLRWQRVQGVFTAVRRLAEMAVSGKASTFPIPNIATLKLERCLPVSLSTKLPLFSKEVRLRVNAADRAKHKVIKTHAFLKP